MTADVPVIRAVVFDCDGLMFNTEEVFSRSGEELLRRRGHRWTDELRQQMMGRRAAEAISAMIEMHSLNDSVEELLEESESIFASYLPDMLAPMPGLFELLEHVEAHGIPKAVATSSHRNYLTDLLQRFDLTHRFQTTLTAEDVSRGKPHPEIYLTAAERLGVAPHEMLVLEDSGAGTRAAADAGAYIVSVPHEFSRSQDFSPARYIAQRLDEPFVLELIRQIEVQPSETSLLD